MKICIIGGTGTLSTPITSMLLKHEDVQLTLVNRGNRLDKIETDQVKLWISDINDEVRMNTYLKDAQFDVVINFINFKPEDIKRDIQYFKGKTKQYIFISTNVVLNHHDHVLIDENTPIGNQISLYGQDKAACEKVLLEANDFPYTIVRPSHTYSDDRFPVSVKGQNTWTVINRIMNHQEIITHDSGQSIWPITHANDFAKLFCSLIGNEAALYEIFHIMNPTPLTWDMIYKEIAKQTRGCYKPVYIPTEILAKSKVYDFDQAIRGDKMFSNIFNVDKILNLNPNFKFEYDLEKGVQSFLNFMDQHEALKTVEEEFNNWTEETIKKYHKLISTITL